MLHQNETLPAAPPRQKLPRRDYLLIPLLSLATVFVMFGAAEICARAIWPEHDDISCFLDLFHAKPNCTMKTKIAEGPWVTYHFNECGYRMYESCGPKRPDVIRIVLMGSSISEGLNVRFEETFAERTVRALRRATGRDVQIENLGFENVSPLHCYYRLNEVLALHPDLVVYPLAPFDLDQAMDPLQLANRNHPNAVLSRPLAHFQVARLKLFQAALSDSRTVVMAQHFLFSNTETYLRLYMAYGDRADYLREPLNARWRARFSDFNLILTDMAARFKQAGVPLLVMPIPSRPQAALLSVARRPPHTDPFAFGRTIDEMAAKLGLGYVDATDEFSRVSHSDHLFYIVESHLTGDGHAVLARALVRKCLDGSIPAFKIN